MYTGHTVRQFSFSSHLAFSLWVKWVKRVSHQHDWTWTEEHKLGSVRAPLNHKFTTQISHQSLCSHTIDDPMGGLWRLRLFMLRVSQGQYTISKRYFWALLLTVETKLIPDSRLLEGIIRMFPRLWIALQESCADNQYLLANYWPLGTSLGTTAIANLSSSHPATLWIMYHMITADLYPNRKRRWSPLIQLGTLSDSPVWLEIGVKWG